MKQVHDYIDKHLDHTIGRLQKIIDINSFTANAEGVEKIQDYLASTLEASAFTVEKERTNPDLASSIYAHNGVPGKGILLVGHSDTVHPPDSPFNSSSREGDIVFGPGSYDMKAGLMMTILVIEALHACGKLEELPIRVLISSDEEIGSPSSYDLHKKAVQESNVGLVFESGRITEKIVLHRKGLSFGTISVKGLATHAGSSYWDGASAIHHLANIISKASSLSSKERDVTVNFGLVSGGTAHNVVAEHAIANFEIRFPTPEDLTEYWEKLTHILDNDIPENIEVSLERSMYFPPMIELERSRELAASYIESLASAGIESSIKEELTGGGSSASILTSEGLTSLCAIGPRGSGAHTHQEQCSIDSLRRRGKALAHWIIKHGPRWVKV